MISFVCNSKRPTIFPECITLFHEINAHIMLAHVIHVSYNCCCCCCCYLCVFFFYDSMYSLLLLLPILQLLLLLDWCFIVHNFWFCSGGMSFMVVCVCQKTCLWNGTWFLSIFEWKHHKTNVTRIPSSGLILISHLQCKMLERTTTWLWK